MGWLKKIDHVTYAVAQGQIEKWAWYHIEVEGGKLINRIDDVAPDHLDSSMKIWCIDFGAFGIALIEGIDRKKKSQVTTFVERHGDHAIQHVAYATTNLENYLIQLKKYNCHLRGEMLVSQDGFGMLKQIFCKGYDAMDPAEMSFSEYVERPVSLEGEDGNISFSQRVGKGFYQQIEDARSAYDEEPLIDFSKMPPDWVPPLA